MLTRIAAAAAAAALLLPGPSVQAAAAAQPAAAARTCDWRVVHRLDRDTTWQYVTPALARYEHIGPCSKVITGQRQSVIIGQDGHVADES